MDPLLQSYFPTFLNPAGPNDQAIANLFWFVTGIGVAVFIVVGGAVLYSAFRFREKPGSGEPRQVSENNRLELIWTLIPIILVAVLFAAGLKVLILNANPPARAQAAGAPIKVGIVGHQFFWQFKYQGTKVVTTKTMEVPAGRVIDLSITSADVIHSFAVTQLINRLDAIPGQVNHTWFIADHPGVWVGQCTEFCGVGHYQMLATIKVVSPAQFQTWLKAQERKAASGGATASGSSTASGA